MRIWHKDLISVLPREQLVSQWRECSAIAGAIKKNGEPNHLLVNKIMDFNYNHFITYSKLVRAEMTKRGYTTMNSVMDKIESPLTEEKVEIPLKELYSSWHNMRYFKQCYYNLQEKFDCGGISKEDWARIERKMHKLEEERYNQMQLGGE